MNRKRQKQMKGKKKKKSYVCVLFIVYWLHSGEKKKKVGGRGHCYSNTGMHSTVCG